jgi:hypothetical protein
VKVLQGPSLFLVGVGRQCVQFLQGHFSLEGDHLLCRVVSELLRHNRRDLEAGEVRMIVIFLCF